MSEFTEQKQFRRIEIWEYVTREDVRANKDKIFLFGDNLAKRGFGGQAKEMRGEKNSVGIPTKKAPNNNPKSFFTDNEFAANKTAIDEAFAQIPSDKILVIPKMGIGTGLARLSKTAPQTFNYLNQKFAEIGFDNQRGKLIEPDNKKVVIQGNNASAQKRLLDLNNIQTNNLQLLSPSDKEIKDLKSSRQKALTDYADRLRQSYKADQDDFRNGMKLLSNSIDKGDQITITCPCHNGEMCHADVVKMAVEKVNLHINKNQILKTEKLTDRKNQNIPNKQKPLNQTQKNSINPRTQRAINEILAFSENDRLLENINQTDGRNRSEQASYLGQQSQFIRDTYERGATVKDGNLIVPQDKTNASKPLFTTTQEYAVKRISKILKDEAKAKEIAPHLVEYGNKISGLVADGETKLKVFNWMYESLEGKSDFFDREESKTFSKLEKFESTLEKISVLAEEMNQLEPTDKLEFVPLLGSEQNENNESFAFTEELEKNIENPDEHLTESQENDIQELDEKISNERFERIELKGDVPRIPEEFSEQEISRYITKTLPEIDKKLENGVSRKEILQPFNEMVWQSAKDDTLNRLEKIFQKQKIAETDNLPSKENTELNQNIKNQLVEIDLFRQNIIELKSPDEYPLAEKDAINTFFRVKKVETGKYLEKLDEIPQKPGKSDDKTLINTYKTQLYKIRESKPSFAYKLRNSSEIVSGEPSKDLINERQFVSSYIDYQLKQPDIRLRHMNERYRDYAKQLENASNRDELIKAASKIRIENAKLGFKWKDLDKTEKESLAQPLSQKEMQFLFTENSPAHFSSEMTALKLSYAHAGASRRQMTESLIKGEISPSPEAQKLLNSLESRLERRELKNSLKATKHFFRSLKTPNESLKYKNDFDHREIYQTLPSQEKDFIYFKATEQKENLQYRTAYKNLQFSRTGEVSRDQTHKLNSSKSEKSFQIYSQYNQARILGEKLESSSSIQKEISERDVSAIAILLKNQTAEKIDLFAQEFYQSENIQNLKVGEVLETFSKAEVSKTEDKTVISIKLPENSLVQIDTYRELLNNFYPDENRDKYKFSSFDEKTINVAREKGQDETINNWRDEILNNVYQTDTSRNISSTEKELVENFDKIKILQQTAREAKRENENIAEKYRRGSASKLLKQDLALPSPIEQKMGVQRALDARGDTPSSDKLRNQFFEAVQGEITISDFQKFSANEKLMAEAKFQIKNEFTQITQQREILEESIINTKHNQSRDEIFEQSATKVQQQENKPLSLQLFEKELERAEKQILSKQLSEKLLENSSFLENEKLPSLENLLSPENREEIKIQAIEIAKEKLEPKELDANHHVLSTEAKDQAIATQEQLEIATEIFQTNSDKSKLNESFSKLDHEAAKLNQIREDYNRKGKLVLLQNGLKSDLADLFKKNKNLKEGDFINQTTKILNQNLDKIGMDLMADRKNQVSSLSKEISLKIEAKQNPKDKDYSVFNYAQNVSNQIPQNSETKEIAQNVDKVKDSIIFQR